MQQNPTTEPEKAHARAAGLTYVSDLEPGIRRKTAGAGFNYGSQMAISSQMPTP
jgi:DNA topoisomerase IB